MSHYVIKLLESNVVDENVAGLLLFKKALETDFVKKGEYSFPIEQAFESLQIEVLCKLLHCSVDLVKKNAAVVLMLACGYDTCMIKLINYLDVLIISVAKETNQEVKSLLESVCNQICVKSTVGDVAQSLCRVYKYILYPDTNNKLSSKQIWTVMSSCMDIIESLASTPVLSYNGGRYLRSIVCMHLNSKHTETLFDDWLALVYRYLLHLGVAWTFALDYSKGAAHTVKSDSFVQYLCNLVFTEVHIVQEELYCLYSEEREAVLAYSQSQIQIHTLGEGGVEVGVPAAALSPVVQRYTRAAAVHPLLWDYIHLFLHCLVAPQQFSIGAGQDDKTAVAVDLCWSDCHCDVLLSVQKVCSFVVFIV